MAMLPQRQVPVVQEVMVYRITSELVQIFIMAAEEVVDDMVLEVEVLLLREVKVVEEMVDN